MKKFLLVIVAISVAFFTTSCEKDSNGNPVYKMNATIDGKQWSAISSAGILTNGSITITGVSLTGESVIINVQDVKVGTYTLSILPPSKQCGASYIASAIPTTANTFISTMGKVTLTKIDETNKLVSGTFNFTLVNNTLAVKQIQGTFNDVSYMVQ